MFPRPTLADLRDLARLAVPVTLVQVGLMAMGVVDTMMVGRVSAEAIGAVALGTVYLYGLSAFGLGLLMALDPVVAQAVGARDQPAVARGVQRGLVLAAGLSVVTAFALWPVRPVLLALGQKPEVVALATPYIQWQIPSLAAFFGFVVLRQSLQAMGRMRPIVTMMIGANLLNAALNWVLIFGHLGVPALGVTGAAIATSLGRYAMAGGLLVLAWRELRPVLSPWRPESLERAPLVRMVRLGAPIGTTVFLEFSVFGAVSLLMGTIGAVAIAAHQIAINIASLTFMVPLGVSSAASVLVGQAVGAGDAQQARRSGVAALAAGVGFMAFSALMLTLFPGPLARAYTHDPAVIGFAMQLIPLAGFFQVFDGTQVVSIGVLRGVGDTRTPMIVNLLGYWLVGLPVSLWLGFRTPLGAPGLWWGLVLGLAVVAMVLLVRVRRRLWAPLERLVIDHPHPDPEAQRRSGTGVA